MKFDRLLCHSKMYLKPVVNVKQPSSKCQKTPVFWHALFRTYRHKLLAGALIKLLNDLFQLSGPMILK